MFQTMQVADTIIFLNKAQCDE